MKRKQKKPRIKGRCSTPFCRNQVPGRTRHCPTCRKRIWREKNPEKDAWLNLRGSARKRNIPFDLPFEDFLGMAYRVEYIKGKGRAVETLTVDRINDNPGKGYHGYRKDNIQVIPRGDNSSKWHLQYDWETRYARIHKLKVQAVDEENYF